MRLLDHVGGLVIRRAQAPGEAQQLATAPLVVLADPAGDVVGRLPHRDRDRVLSNVHTRTDAGSMENAAPPSARASIDESSQA
jgi:hypothetical protein